MGKIIKIDGDIISIGNEDNTITEVRTADCNFVANIGDEVTIFASGESVIVNKVEPTVAPISDINEKININVVNDNGHAGAQGVTYKQGKVVNKLVYVLLAFFLGAIGGHKFYAGKIGSGILYFLFSWTVVPFIISVVELIVALLKKADSNGNIVV